jgi:hypothetical protein
MRKTPHIASMVRHICLFVAIATLSIVAPARCAADDQLDALLERTGRQMSSFLDLLSEMNCTEHVLQEKLGEKGKVVEKEASTYDYLIILSTQGGDLNLVESRIAPENAKQQKKARAPLLISNGFSTLFLVFHPHYSPSFQFTLEGEESLNGRTVTKIRFQHIPGMRSPAALAVRGREYPLDVSGTAWIDGKTGTIAQLTANVDSGMEDVGLRTLHSAIRFAPVTFHNSAESIWLPAEVNIEVETRHQHWRNTHQFSDYRRFSVNTKEQIAKQ